jgi:hypothetical protein
MVETRGWFKEGRLYNVELITVQLRIYYVSRDEDLRWRKRGLSFDASPFNDHVNKVRRQIS